MNDYICYDHFWIIYTGKKLKPATLITKVMRSKNDSAYLNRRKQIYLALNIEYKTAAQNVTGMWCYRIEKTALREQNVPL
jgi:hypothetical protein